MYAEASHPQQPTGHDHEQQHGVVQQRSGGGPNSLCAMSLENYMAIRKALTKGESCVQPVHAVERAMYRMTDLRQVPHAAAWSSMQCAIASRELACAATQMLLMHGLSTGAKTKQVQDRFVPHAYMHQPTAAVLLTSAALLQDVLNAMEGLRLVSPMQGPEQQGAQQHGMLAACSQPAHLGVSAADLALLGWALPGQEQACTAAMQVPQALSARTAALQVAGSVALPNAAASNGRKHMSEQQAVPHAQTPNTASMHDPKVPVAAVLPNSSSSAHAAERHASAGQCREAQHAAVAPISLGIPGDSLPLLPGIPDGQEAGMADAGCAAPGMQEILCSEPQPGHADDGALDAATHQAKGGWRRKRPAAAAAAVMEPLPALEATTQELQPEGAGDAVAAHATHVDQQPSSKHEEVIARGAAEGSAEEGVPEKRQQPADAAPSWLEGQVQALARSSRSAALPAMLDGGALTGRSVAVVLLEPFESGGEALPAALHVGRWEPLSGMHDAFSCLSAWHCIVLHPWCLQYSKRCCTCCRVMEYIGCGHLPDVCCPVCSQQHSFYFVRITAAGVSLVMSAGVSSCPDCACEHQPYFGRRRQPAEEAGAASQDRSEGGLACQPGSEQPGRPAMPLPSNAAGQDALPYSLPIRRPSIRTHPSTSMLTSVCRRGRMRGCCWHRGEEEQPSIDQHWSALHRYCLPTHVGRDEALVM
jgi:hypothetical protein